MKLHRGKVSLQKARMEGDDLAKEMELVLEKLDVLDGKVQSLLDYVTELETVPAVPVDEQAPGLIELGPDEEPPWLTIARSYLGLHERRDAGIVMKIITAANLAHVIPSPETPWCAGFVGGVLEETGIRGTGTALARDYAVWGQACEARPGAVAVFPAHVAFVVEEGEPSEGLKILGGNQSDKICIQPARYYGEVMAFRFPEGYKV